MHTQSHRRHRRHHHHHQFNDDASVDAGGPKRLSLRCFNALIAHLPQTKTSTSCSRSLIHLYRERMHQRQGRRARGQGPSSHHNCSDPLACPVGILLANYLLLMYAVCGQPENARNLFEEMPARDSIPWATMITTLSDSGYPRNTLELFVDSLCLGELSGCCFMAAISIVLRSCHRMVVHRTRRRSNVGSPLPFWFMDSCDL